MDSDVATTAENLTAGTRDKYVELVEDLDAQIGRILHAIDDAKLAGKTLVVFASDHGAMKPGRNAPFSNFKSTVFEGGIRAPLIMRWPGHLKAGMVSKQTCITFDLTRSLLRIAGADVPAGHKLDGIDIVAHVEDAQPDLERTLFWRGRRGERTERAMREGRWKYIHRRLDDGSEHEYLFDLYKDPTEQTNALEEQPRIANIWRKRLATWEEEMK
jgi:N-acetylgalactosamine-6-sulfatase